MSEPDGTIVTLGALKEEVGSLFFLWAQVEQDLAEARRAQGASAERSLGETVARWAHHEVHAGKGGLHRALVQHVRAELRAGIEIRNRFAHGLVGWRARLHPEQDEARYITRLGEEQRELTYCELKTWNSYVAQLSSSVARLTWAAGSGDLEFADVCRDVSNLLRQAAPPGRPIPP